jgi:hypothetical protein
VVSRRGALTLLEAVAGATPPGTSPIDLAVSRSSSYLYSLAGGTISIFGVSGRGRLRNLGVITGLPATTVGMAAR